jgi:signal transduction histidine kinase
MPVARRDLPVAAPERVLSDPVASSPREPVPVPAYLDFTPELLAHFPLTEVSAALRAQTNAIILAWTALVKANIPAASKLPFDQLADNLPNILPALADALGSTDAEVRHRLLERSPQQGITRFQQHYHARDLMFEDRLLSQLVILHIEKALGRPMALEEHLAVGMGLDLMTQQAIVAFIDHQSSLLRTAAEAELRFLSFLSHDLNNNLSGVTLWLQVLRTQLKSMPELDEQVAAIDTIQQQILTTVGGMGRLLQAERLRHGGRESKPRSVDLRTLVTNQTRVFAEQASRRGLRIIVDVPRDADVISDPELISLVLQNLIGNAAKFATPGDLSIIAKPHDTFGKRTQWSIAVIDQGPGIPKEHVDRIFHAFQRGTMEGEAGVGLGLAIASRAASLLGGSLTVESEIGTGSTFTLTLPPS